MTMIDTLVYSLGGNYPGIFLLMVLESASLPVPSELVMTLAGYYVRINGNLTLWGVIVAGTMGSLIGSYVDYAIGKYGGLPLVKRYGKYVLIDEAKLRWVDNLFLKWGGPIVFLSRFIPLVRTLISFPAGIAEMSLWKFLIYTASGNAIWDTILALIGYEFASAYSSILSHINQYLYIITIAIVIILIIYLLYKRKFY